MKKLSTAVIFSGLVIIAISVNIIIFTFYPVISAEIKYLFSNKNPQVVSQGQKTNYKNVIRPIDENFGIVIPKIGANAKIIANVDPYNSNAYQTALTRGVAHARGSSFPDMEGNVFIFSHSSVNFYEAVHYNSIFYLISKLNKDDEINIFYKKQKYVYKVIDKKVVNPNDVQYINSPTTGETLTLMTCTPAGTTIKRLIIIAQAAD